VATILVSIAAEHLLHPRRSFSEAEGGEITVRIFSVISSIAKTVLYAYINI
jgi:hypothetical protein